MSEKACVSLNRLSLTGLACFALAFPSVGCGESGNDEFATDAEGDESDEGNGTEGDEGDEGDSAGEDATGEDSGGEAGDSSGEEEDSGDEEEDSGSEEEDSGEEDSGSEEDSGAEEEDSSGEEEDSGESGDEEDSGSEDDSGSDSGEDSGSDDGGDDPPVLPCGNPGEWVWVPFPDTQCRDGSEAGLAVRCSEESTNVMIYLQGGGACFNLTTCLANPASVSAMDGGNEGVFNIANAANPVAEWNHVFIPYCTGDVFFGANPGANVPGGPQNQQFVGYDNMTQFIERIVPTFEDAEQVLLTGGSAGGFGAALNFDRVQQAFGDTEVVLVDDSGPPMDDMYMTPCLQQQWRDIWGFDEGLPDDCTDCFNADGGGLINMVPFLAEKYPNNTLSLVSSEQDSTIRTFFGYGKNDCSGLGNMSAAEFEMGLYDLRDNWAMDYENWGSFAIEGSTHTWIATESRFYTEVNGVVLADWMGDVLAGSPTHVSP